MGATTAEFTDTYGVKIVYDKHEGKAPVRGVIQLLHGVGEHAGRYDEVIGKLTDAGFIVYADDHRGHGRTGIQQHEGDASKLGKLGPGGHNATLDAVWQLSEIAHAENPGLPLILLGHSWGSFLAQMLLNEHPEAYSGLILSGSAYRVPGSLSAKPLNARWAGPEAHGLEWLSRDPEVWKQFRDDPLTTEEPMMKLFGVADTLKMFGRPKKGLADAVNGTFPILLMVGRDDSVGGAESNHKLAEAYKTRSGFDDVTVFVYPEGRHEIFNEPEREQVFGDLLGWLDQHYPA